MKRTSQIISTYMAFIFFAIFLFVITCTKEPAGPNVNDNLKPKGSIAGYAYDRWNNPIKGVLVSVNADSAVPGISNETGYFKVGQVKAGTHKLHFTHADYVDDSSHSFTLGQGEHDTLDDTVFLSYGYFILKGRVTYSGGAVVMAGVVIDNLLLSTLTNTQGLYLFNRVQKENKFTLICAKTDIGYGEASGIVGITDDTTFIPDIVLVNEGGNIKGTVYDTLLKPVPFAIVHAVGGGLVDTADANGNYSITNFPSNTMGIPVYVPEKNGLTGAVSGLNVDENGTLLGIDIYLHKASDLSNGMKIITHDIFAIDTVAGVDVSVTVICDTGITIRRYEWFLRGAPAPDTITQTSHFTLALKKLRQLRLHSSTMDEDIPVEVRALSGKGLYSSKAGFHIFLRGIDPVITCSVSIHPDSAGKDTVSVTRNQTVYFKTAATVLSGGVDTLEWNFGDGAVKIIHPDSLKNVYHAYKDTGLYSATARLKDIYGKEARDTVVVIVKQGAIAPTIVTDPQPVAVLEGQPATFYVSATGTRPLSYQWIKITLLGGIDTSFVTIPGANDSSYTISVTTISDSGSRFQCIVRNSAGTDTSKAALLIVSKNVIAPVITGHPKNATVTVGMTATFSVSATGTEPLNYQWLKDNNTIGSATNPSYTTPAAVLADSGATYRCVVRNSAGKDTSDAAQLIVTTETLVTDIDGNFYRTVTIGTQTWMVENLKTTKFTDGTAITLVTDNQTWANLVTPAYCWHNNDSTNKPTYGALYNWHVVNTGKLAPTGWRVATTADWTTLFTYLGGDSVAGGKLKEAGLAHWNSPNTGATNENGFSALPGGSRASSGAFGNTGGHGFWWSSSENDSSMSWLCNIAAGSAGASLAKFNKHYGVSVRCVKGAVTVKPAITGDPQPKTVTAGQTATFGVVATGTRPFTYQWQKNGADISGAVDSSYSTPAAVQSDSGSLFRCIVANSAGADTSAVALLKVIITQFVNISGKVTDTGNTPIPGASVKLEKGGLTATTGVDGSFTLTGTTGQNNQSLPQAESYAPINDVIAVTKAGYLNYRVLVTTSDTSGIEIKMIICAGTVTDVDGNVYQTVKIGNQVWMVENLMTTKYNDGSAIPLVTDSAAWFGLTTPGYCYYNNTTNVDSIKKYGALYNWYAVDTTKRLAPVGWHVPTDAEWDTLQDYLIANGYNWDGTTTGNKIAKSLAAKADWIKSSTTGVIGNDLAKNNSSGFSALPGGFRDPQGNFSLNCRCGYWWSATESAKYSSWLRCLFYDYDYLARGSNPRSTGYSVRVLKD